MAYQALYANNRLINRLGNSNNCIASLLSTLTYFIPFVVAVNISVAVAEHGEL